MNTSEQILVIFLSTALGVLLVLSIIFVILAIKIANHIKHITSKAEKIADKADSITDFFQTTGPALAVAKMVGNIMDSVKSKHTSRKGDK